MKENRFSTVSKIALGLVLAQLIPLPCRALLLTDLFAARPQVTGATAVFSGNSVGAASELGEPDHGGNRRRTLWGAWTAPGDGTVTISTMGSAFNTVLAAYVGAAVDRLTPVAANNDAAAGFVYSVITFPTKTGVTYSFAVDGAADTAAYEGNVAVGVTFVAQTQPGAEVGTDRFGERPALPSLLVARGVADNRLAQLDLDEPPHLGGRDHTVWWRWVAPANGLVTMDTFGSAFDTTLTVYTGSVLTNLARVAINDDAPNVAHSRVSFQAQAGLEYQLMVDGANNTASYQGNIMLNVSLTPNFEPAGVVGADAFNQRGILEGANARGVANNIFAGRELDEPAHGSGRNHTVWWQWTAPADGLVDIRTEGSEFDTYLVVYTGASMSSLQPVAANDNQVNVTWSRVQFLAQRGVVYKIMVDGRNNTASYQGNIKLSVNQALASVNTLGLRPAVEIEIPGLSGVLYQLQSTTDLMNWINEGESIAGAGQPVRLLKSTRDSERKFFRYVTIP